VKLINTEGKSTLIYIPTLTLAWSRHNSRKLVLDTKTETLISYLAETFEQLGGVPKELVIDNLKAFVEKPKTHNSPAIINSKFEEFCKDYGITPITCMPSRPKTKGKTETQNKIVDQLKNYNGTYNDIDDMHKMLEIINKEDNEKPSQATKLPRTFLLQKEKGALNPLPTTEIRQKYHLKLNEVQVSKESLISYKSNKYSVPKKYIGLKVGLTVIRDELHIYYNKKIITIHKITNNLLNIKSEHNLIYEKKKEKLKEKSTILEEMERIKYD
jgi:putative transposon-encoded protein